MTPRIVALVGGSGHLGGLIANALLDRSDVQLRLLVRQESRAKVAALEQRGAQIIEGSLDPSHRGPLSRFVEGADTVVSAVQGGPAEIIDGQASLLRIARTAGVRRFIPSDYSLDLFSVPLGRIVTSNWRRQFAQIAQQERGTVEVVHILNGGFLDRRVLFGFLNVIDPVQLRAHVWGEGQTEMHWTTCHDIAAYTAEAALDRRPLPRCLSVAGEVSSFHGLVAAYEAASGKKLSIIRLGSIEDLDQRIAELVQGGPQNFLSYLPLMYYRSMLLGEGRLQTLMNHLYPHIKPTDLQAYVRQESL